MLNCGGHADHMKMVDLVNVWENHIHSFKNLPLQTHQSEWYQIWVTTIGQGHEKLHGQWSYFFYIYFSN